MDKAISLSESAPARDQTDAASTNRATPARDQAQPKYSSTLAQTFPSVICVLSPGYLLGSLCAYDLNPQELGCQLVCHICHQTSKQILDPFLATRCVRAFRGESIKVSSHSYYEACCLAVFRLNHIN